MKYFKEYTVKAGLYGASLLLAFSMGVPLFPGVASAGHSEATGPRFCVILKPEVKEVASVGDVGMVKLSSDPLEPVTTDKIKNFFTGNMAKVGFGAPRCFFINDQIQNNPVIGSQPLHAGPADYLEGLATERRGRDFFPSAGFFSRSSQEGRLGMAIGLGLSGASPSELEGEAGSPAAKASLMFGIGF